MSSREQARATALLSAHDEAELSRTIEAGVVAGEALATGVCPVAATRAELRLLVAAGAAAFEQMMLANLGLVRLVVAAEVRRTGLDRDELYQEGCLGLAEAVRRFNHSDGARFATYAIIWIRKYVLVAVAGGCGALPVPARRAHQLRSALRVAADLEQRLGRSIGADDLARVLGRSRGWVEQLLATARPMSLDVLVADGIDVGCREDEEEPDVMSDLRTRVRALDPLRRTVVELRYGFVDGRCWSAREVGRRQGMSERPGRRFESDALERLQEPLHGVGLRAVGDSGS